MICCFHRTNTDHGVVVAIFEPVGRSDSIVCLFDFVASFDMANFPDCIIALTSSGASSRRAICCKSTGFNSMLGGAIGFCYLSYGVWTRTLLSQNPYAKPRSGAPAAVMLFCGRSNLEKTPYSLGKLGYPLALVSVAYVSVTVVLSVVC